MLVNYLKLKFVENIKNVPKQKGRYSASLGKNVSWN